ncbi:MAG: small ribosomal subunit Rsm22 family protein [Clostridia bacterium]|nr:small ribosomal subunit Rsm22 family protein [Clostridia bacterium]
MDIPQDLKANAERLTEGYSQALLRKTAQNLSDRYRNDSGAGKKLCTEDIEAAVYSLVRMPATYGAVSDAINYALEYYDGEPIKTLLDVGAGTGAASWAVSDLLTLDSITCLEREAAMRNVGSELMLGGSDVLQRAKWIEADLISSNNLCSADLVIESYVLNEMSATNRNLTVEKLWNSCNRMLILVEPGSKPGFNVIKEARSQLLKLGAHIIAPCPHEDKCRLESDDWCHFTCRVQRSKIHRLLKDGDVPYEDEKYSYIAAVHSDSDCRRASSRILRHPYIDKGQVRVELCSTDSNSTVTIRKRDGDIYKSVRKAKQGDSLSY